jgi:hypothetical protein
MAAEFDCLLASGIETGGEGSLLKTHLPQALIRKPFAYRPPRKINRVDVETKLARPTPTTNRAFIASSTFVLAIWDITETFR